MSVGNFLHKLCDFDHRGTGTLHMNFDTGCQSSFTHEIPFAGTSNSGLRQKTVTRFYLSERSKGLLSVPLLDLLDDRRPSADHHQC